MAYSQSDDAQNNDAQNYSVYAQESSAAGQDSSMQGSTTSMQASSQDNPVQDSLTQENVSAQTTPDFILNDNLQGSQSPAQSSPVYLQKESKQRKPLQNSSVPNSYPPNNAPQNSGTQNAFIQHNTEQRDYVQNDPVYTQSNPLGTAPYSNIPLLQLNDLCKRYPGMGTYMSVFHMNLIIPRGRIIGLLGPNGCGKTTLIKMINGLLAPTCGNVLINGMEPSPATKKVISYLPERTYLDNGMKVSQMVEYFADFYEDFSTEKAYGMLGALGISSDARLKTLSKGTKEKVQLILVMSRQADLYILDEPIAGVDPAARDYILRTIITNYNPGSTIILSTHLISDIENILDDVIFMKNGSLMLYTSVDSIRSQMGKSVDTYFREVYAC